MNHGFSPLPEEMEEVDDETWSFSLTAPKRYGL